MTVLYRESAADAAANAAELCAGLKEAVPVQQHMAEAHMQASERGAPPAVTHTGAVPSLHAGVDTGTTPEVPGADSGPASSSS